MTWTRRRALRAGGAVAGLACIIAGVLPASGRQVDLTASLAKRLTLVNLHTQEYLDVDYCRGAEYVPGSMSAIAALLRDFRSGEMHPIDPALLDHLYEVAQNLGVEPVFGVISGYRSPQTNRALRLRTSGVARHSLHLEGRAIDLRLHGVDSATVAGCARDMRRGGVGYYRRSDFVHLDTGAYRTWNG